MSAVIESDVTVVRSGEGPSVWVLGDRVEPKLGPEHTRGAFSLAEITVSPGGGPPPHVHGREDELFVVLEGELSFLRGDRLYRATPGSCVYLPKGVPHTFKNAGERPARFLAVATPCGFERFLAALGSPARPASPEVTPADVQRLLAAAAEFGLDMNPALPGPPTDAGTCPDGQCRWVLGVLVTTKLTAAETRGNFSVAELELRPRTDGPPPHTHRAMDETFYVLEGTIEFHLDGRTEALGPGSLVHVPRGVPHTFRNRGDVPARMLDVHTPGGFEAFFEEAGTPATDRTNPPARVDAPDVDALIALLDRHGMELAR